MAGEEFSCKPVLTITDGLTRSIHAGVGLGEVIGACSQAQKESSRRERKASHWAAVLSKKHNEAAKRQRRAFLEVLCEKDEAHLLLACL